MLLIIPGTEKLSYGGGTLSEDAAETTSAAIIAYGMPFIIDVNNIAVMTGTMGFSLQYSQVPCGSTVTSTD